MIDGERADFSAAPLRPSIGEDRESQAVGAARHRDGDKRCRFERR